ncbi:MAG: PQQ-dependent sugar dehydrogenase [Pirellulaceae bacterium]
MFIKKHNAKRGARWLLSAVTTIQIIAAGTSGTENMSLLIDNVVVQSWTNIGGNANNGTFNTFQFVANGDVTADRIRVAFTNDASTRDLRIDKMVVNDVDFQSEAENVLSTGTWAYGGCTPGYFASEWLHCNGHFQYSTIPRGPGPIPGVAGIVETTDVWKPVSDPVPFAEPVVIAGPVTRNDATPGAVALKLVDASGFDIAFQEWVNEDGPHGPEKIDWLTLPKGRFTSNDGSVWEIGSFELNGNGVWQAQNFSAPFIRRPKLFLTIQTNDGGAPLIVRTKNVEFETFSAALFSEESLAGVTNPSEIVGYLAVDPAAPSGAVTIGNQTFPYLFENLFVSSNLTSSAAGYALIASEDTSADSETSHLAERTNVLRLGELTFAQDYVFRSPDPFSFRIEKVPNGVILEPGFRIRQLVSASEFENPVDLEISPDGRIFVAEEGGKVWIVQNGVKLPTPYLDLGPELFRGFGDEGALSAIALDPDFANNGLFYALYTAQENGFRFGRLSRWRAYTNNANRAHPISQKILIGQNPVNGLIQETFHNVGDIRFGTDGTLLFTWGDTAGNGENDPGQYRSQQLDTAAGKLFRVSRFTGLGIVSNPYYTGNAADTRSKVFASGLRNGFRMAVHPAGGQTFQGAGKPGTIYVAEVGRYQADEINIAKRGENFGWPIYEGNSLYRPDGQPITHKAPVVEFLHPETRCLIGGVFYKGTKWPAQYFDTYLAIDFVTGWLRAFQHNADHSVLTPLPIGTGIKGVTAMAIDPATERIYFLGRGRDIIFAGGEGFSGLFYLEYVAN